MTKRSAVQNIFLPIVKSMIWHHRRIFLFVTNMWCGQTGIYTRDKTKAKLKRQYGRSKRIYEEQMKTEKSGTEMKWDRRYLSQRPLRGWKAEETERRNKPYLQMAKTLAWKKRRRGRGRELCEICDWLKTDCSSDIRAVTAIFTKTLQYFMAFHQFE